MVQDKEATIFIFDVGKDSVAQKSGINDENFFATAKECILKKLQMKIMSKSEDETSIVLMGTDATQNELHQALGGYDHISEAFELAIPTWKKLRIIKHKIQATEHESDWLDALIVAINFLRNSADQKNFTSYKIIIFNTFETAVIEENFDSVLASLNDMEIKLWIVTNGVDTSRSSGGRSQEISKSKSRRANEKLIDDLINGANCVLYDIKHADKLVSCIHTKQPRSVAFNVDLEIGSQLKIKTAIYKSVAVTKPYDSWKTVSGAPRDVIKMETEHFKNDKPYDPDPENTIDGYMYGSTIVPYDKGIVSDYNSGGKCFMCLGFTPKSVVLEEYFCGADTSVAVPQKNFSASQVMFAALVDAMIELDVIMIARKVYNIRSAPKIFACLPTRMHENYPAMTVLELPFSENLIDLTVPSLSGKRFHTTQDQDAVIDELIDSMDLMSANEDVTGEFVEAYEVGKFPNPAAEHILKTIAFRALHPKEKIPNPSHEEMAVAPVPAVIRDRTKPVIEAVKAKFELETVKKPAKVEWQLKHLLPDATATTSQPMSSDEARIVAVGSVTPAEDFALLLRNGERFATLCTQIQNVVSDLVFKQIAIQDEKVVKALWIFRDEARQLGPFYYNNWIDTFKASLVARKRSDFWEQVIVKEGLGLIGAGESEMSTVTDAECEEFYKFGGGMGVTHDVAEGNVDIDELFEDM